MSTETQQNNNMGMLSRPSGDSSALKIRLDTSKLLDDIELFLRGTREKLVQDGDGSIKYQTIHTGKPKMNDEGIRSVLNWINGTINIQAVQGNFPVDKHGFSEKYENYVCEYHIELTDLIIKKAPDWEIDDLEIDGVIAFVMLLVQPFFSRLIGNKERESFADTIKTIESNSIQARGGFKLFNK